jgi:hypothetical protein
MSKEEKELDEYGRRTLAPLRPAAAIDPAKAEQIKRQFLMQGESLRQGMDKQAHTVQHAGTRRRSGLTWLVQPGLLRKVLFAIFIAMIIVFASSSLTVLAAQSSLPGDTLYPVKTWSENLRYSFTLSRQAKLNLTLDYTNIRMNEISSLVAQGRMVSDQTSSQYKQQLNNVLELAVQMDDTQLEAALQQIMDHAGKQEAIVQRLINQVPPQAQPAMQRLQERLATQVQLSALGEADPKTFKMELQEKLHQQQGRDESPSNQQPEINPGFPSSTPAPNEDSNTGGGNKSGQPTEMPGNGGPGNSQGQPMPGNGNHQPNPQRTANP